LVSRKKIRKKKDKRFILAVRSITISTPKSIKESIITQAANMLACYRKNCAQSTAAGQLILPETLKLLPVYICSLIKSDALTGSMLEIFI
jgi:protein transport protein SEC24